MKRRYYTGDNVTKALSIEELRRRAHRYLPGFALEYLEGEAEDELSLAWNRQVFEQIRFRPRTLVNTDTRSTRVTLWGLERPTPLIVAPTGHNGLFRRNGDTMLARAAGSMTIPYTLSTLSNTRLERLAKDAPGPLWMQLYVFNDFDLTRDILKRAAAAGYEALVFTSDTNVHGWREWDRRQFRAPGRLKRRVGLEALWHPHWLFDVIIPHGVPRLENVVDSFPANVRDTRGAFVHIPTLFAPTITWDSVDRLRELWPRKLLIKGILRA
jgi:(S)-mandelate dehydrogenase